MKRIILHIIIALTALTAMTGCTQNDGHIGDLFGVWRLEKMTADGTEVKLYDAETLLYTWRFQEKVIYIQTLLPHEDFDRAKGMFIHPDDGKTLTLSFDFSDTDGTIWYTPPTALCLEKVTVLTVNRLDSKHLDLTYTNSDTGITYTYSLRKAY